MEEWKPWRGERQEAASWDDSSEANFPFEAQYQAWGRCCSALGYLLWGRGTLQGGSGNVGRRRSSLNEAGWEQAAGGGSLERRPSLGWASLQGG